MAPKTTLNNKSLTLIGTDRSRIVFQDKQVQPLKTQVLKCVPNYLTKCGSSMAGGSECSGRPFEGY